MSITFACGQCGKTFTLEDRFAGKKGRCKDCGQVMLIPALRQGAESRRLKTTARGDEAEERRDPSIFADVYGFDEPPTPSRVPTPVQQAAPDASPVPPIKKKKKKSVGFFAGGGGKSKGSSSGGGFLSVDLSSGLARTGLGLLFVFVILPIGYGVMLGISPRSTIEAFQVRHIKLMNDLAGLLKKVDDPDSARNMSVAINESIRALNKHIRDNMHLKARRRDLDDVIQKYLNERVRAEKVLEAEFTRLGAIAGVGEELNVSAAIEENERVMREAQQLEKSNP